MATQGAQANAKDSTLYYGDGGNFASMAVDLSQYADNQTVAVWGHYEPSPATRFNVTTTWCAEVIVELDNTDTGRFFTYSNMSLRLSAGGAVEPILNGGVLTGITLPGVSGSAQRFVIAWATEPNLLTTGAGNALRTELRAWNTDTGAYTQTTYTHAARTSGTSDFIWWASSNAGANAFSGSAEACRFSATRFISATETHEDFVAMTSAPTLDNETRIEFPIVEPANALSEPGQFAGPVRASRAASARSMALRCLGPIVNVSYSERPTIARATLSGLPSAWLRAALDVAYMLAGNYSFYRPVPTYVTRLRVRVHVQQWRTSGATADRVHLRMYAMTRPPKPVAAPVDLTGPLIAYPASGSIATNHGSGSSAGEWVDLGELRPARNSDGCVWFALALRVEDLSGATEDNRFRINAITIDPMVS